MIATFDIKWVRWVVAGLIVAYTLLLLDKHYGWIAFILWLSSWILLMLHRRLVIGWKLPWREFYRKWGAGVLAIGGLYIARFFLLWSEPDWLFFHGDEAMLSQWAMEAVEVGIHRGEWNFLGSFPSTLARLPALWYYLTGSLVYGLGPSLFSAKLLAMISDFGIALCVFGLMQRWLGVVTGLLAGLIYASLPAVIHFGMTGYQNIQSTLGLVAFWCLIDQVWCLDKSVSERRWYLFSAGLVSGLSMYFYLSSVLIPIWAVLWIGLLGGQTGIARWVSLREFGMGFLLTSLPFWIYSFTEFNFLAGRSDAIVQDLSGRFWLSQVRTTLGGLYFGQANGSGAFYVDLPLIHNLLGLVLVIIGLIGGIWYWKKIGRQILMMVSVVVVTLWFGGVLTETPPAPQRLLHVLPVLAMLMAGGIYVIGNFLVGYLNTKLQWLVVGLLGLGLILSGWIWFGLQNVPLYQKQIEAERALVSWYETETNRHWPILGDVPVHVYDRVYFDSHGAINMQPFSSPQDMVNILQTFGGFWYLTTSEGRELLKEIGNYKVTKIPLELTDPYNQFELYAVEMPDK
jgi:hypothetical protein